MEAFYADAGTLCLWVTAAATTTWWPERRFPRRPHLRLCRRTAPPTAPVGADSPAPLSIPKARSAALTKAKQMWRARKPKVVKVRRVNSSTVTVRVMWRSKSGTKQVRTLKVKRTRLAGTRASAA